MKIYPKLKTQWRKTDFIYKIKSNFQIDIIITEKEIAS